jgi:hypothetical protein
MERLGITSEKSQSARYDASESDRVVKFNECLNALKRMYPGVHGRLVDLCTPVMKKYEDALGLCWERTLMRLSLIPFLLECLEVSCIHVLTTLVFQGAAGRQRYIHSS